MTRNKGGKPRVPAEAAIIGNNLRFIRKCRGLSQAGLARKMSLTTQQVQKYESGLNRLPIDKLYLAKHLFAVPYDYFFTGLERTRREQADLLPAQDPAVLEACLRLMNLRNRKMREKIGKVVCILSE